MIDAARDLFLEQGYARTTIADVARAADVAPQTVYWAFGSKAGLVREIRDAWFASARTSERMGQVLAIDDPAARLDAFAGLHAQPMGDPARPRCRSSGMPCASIPTRQPTSPPSSKRGPAASSRSSGRSVRTSFRA